MQITLDRYSHLMPHLGAALTARLDGAYADVQPEKKAEGGKVVPLK